MRRRYVPITEDPREDAFDYDPSTSVVGFSVHSDAEFFCISDDDNIRKMSSWWIIPLLFFSILIWLFILNEVFSWLPS